MFVFKHYFGDAELQVEIVVGGGRRLAREMPVGTRDHD